jgi:hypothetical protein
MFYEELIVLEELQTKAVSTPNEGKIIDRNSWLGETISKEKLTSQK